MEEKGDMSAQFKSHEYRGSLLKSCLTAHYFSAIYVALNQSACTTFTLLDIICGLCSEILVY